MIDLTKARGSKFSRSSIVGEIPVGRAPVALSLVNGGRYLLSTSQVALPAYNFEPVCKPEGTAGGATPRPMEPQGVIYAIDVAKAEVDPANSIVSKTPAGCHPVRLAVAPDGQTAWVSARASNAALAFSIPKLIAGDASAKLAEVAVGTAPVPIFVTPDSAFVLVGNSNRFGLGAQGNQVVTVVDAHRALAPGNAVLGQISVGLFPREFSRTRSGSAIFLSNYTSETLMVFDPRTIGKILKPIP